MTRTTQASIAALLGLTCACELPGSGDDDPKLDASTMPVVTVALDCGQDGPAESVRIHPEDPQQIWVYQTLGVAVPDRAQTLMVSTDGGASLQKLPVEHLGAPALVADGALVDTSSDGYVYVTPDGAVSSLTFSPDPDAGAPLGSQIARGPGGLDLAITQQRQALWRKNGQQWRSYPDQFIGALSPDDLYSANDQDVWFIDTQNKLAVSTDGGYRFSNRTLPFTARALAVAQGVAWISGSYFGDALDMPPLHISRDDGKSFEKTALVGVVSAMSAVDDQTLYLAASPRKWQSGQANLPHMWLRTTDGGQTFSQLRLQVGARTYTDPGQVQLTAYPDGQLTARIFADEDADTQRTLLCRAAASGDGGVKPRAQLSMPAAPGQIARAMRYRTQLAPAFNLAIGGAGLPVVGVGGGKGLDLGAARGVVEIDGPWSRFLDVWPLSPTRVVAIGQPQDHTIGKSYDPQANGLYEAVLIDIERAKVVAKHPLAIKRVDGTDKYTVAPIDQWTRLADGRFAALAEQTLYTFHIDEDGAVRPDSQRPIGVNVGVPLAISPDGTQHAAIYYPSSNTTGESDYVRVNDVVCGDEMMDVSGCYRADRRFVDAAISDDGTVYVIDGTRGRLLSRGLGDAEWRVVAEGFLHPTHVQLDPMKGDDLIYVVDGDVYALIPGDNTAEVSR